MPESKHDEIVGKFDDDEEAKRELITTWLTGHPCPTWEHVRDLMEIGVRSEEGWRAALEVEETYLNSELVIITFVNNNIEFTL
jgi:hypothetical protein